MFNNEPVQMSHQKLIDISNHLDKHVVQLQQLGNTAMKQLNRALARPASCLDCHWQLAVIGHRKLG